MKKILCWLLALLLTGTLVLFGVSYAVSRAMDPLFREGGKPVSAATEETEMSLIRDRISELADIYGFDADRAQSMVTPEKLREMNAQAASWWNSVLANGETADAPAFDTAELISAMEEDAAAAGNGEEELSEEAQLNIEEAANAVGESILRIVLPMRLPVITLGLSKAAERVDVANVIRFLMGIRWAALALCALLAGLIALLESRKLRVSLKYIGAAMGASVLVLIGCAALYVLSGVQPLIAEASPSLLAQYGELFSGALLRLIAFAVLMCGGCVAFLILCGRGYEAEKD